MYSCEFCKKEVKNKNGLTNHERRCDLNLNKIKRNLDMNKISICKFCGKECKGSSSGHTVVCLLNPKREINLKNRNATMFNRIVSEKTKAKISASRIKYLNENPDKVPYRLNHSSKESYPEKCFRECLEKNKIKGWIKEMPFLRFSIDFAFPEFKMAVEIDGSTHNSEKVKEIDKRKTEALNNEGWRVIRFTAKRINTEVYQCMNEVLTLLGEKQIEIPLELMERKRIKEVFKKNEKTKISYFENINKNLKNIVETCEIDFSIYGWRLHLSNLFNYSVHATVNWMKKNMKEFYDERCFKFKRVKK
jgi:very-short-patch-repair endonuclease